MFHRQFLALRRLGTSFVLALGALAALPAAAQTLVVDDFSAPAPAAVSVLVGVGEESLNQFTATVPGGVRGVYHHNYFNPLNSIAALAVGNGSLSSSTGVGARTEVLVSYGAFTRPTGDPNVGGPLLGLDLTPYNAFRFEFTGVSDVLNVIAVMYTHAPLDPVTPLYYTTAAVNQAPAVAGGTMDVILPFTASDPFNFAQVDGIVFLINRSNATTNVSYNLDRFSLVSAVPEPTPAWLLLGGAALLVLRRRKSLPQGA
ncbi:MAG: PEP-CTERM sorting domain-containing protein [Rubrivivax sp.]|nr:PEP-CTERM sorting domain-containing protein [Rubrivivax sp.]